MLRLEQRWFNFWEGSGAKSGSTKIHGRELQNRVYCYLDLMRHYETTGRRYHTLEHILAMLKEFEFVSGIATDSIAVECAIWYHDIFYDPKAHDNEEKSVELFNGHATQFGFKSNLVEKVPAMILATKHTSPVTDWDTQILCDIDLAILGQSPATFEEYEWQIRREYDWVPDDKFKVGRVGILKMFLDRPSIYYTEFFRNKYEEQARKNLKHSIAKLLS